MLKALNTIQLLPMVHKKESDMERSKINNRNYPIVSL